MAVHVLDPKQKLVPTPGELQLADGSRPRRLRGKQHVDLLPPKVSKLLWTTTGGSAVDLMSSSTSSTSTSSKTSSTNTSEQKGDENEQINPDIQKYLDHLQSVYLMEHHALCRLRREEAQVADDDLIGETLMEIDNEIEKLERSLKAFAVCEPAVETCDTDSLFRWGEGVRKELNEWRTPIKEE